MAIIWGTFLYKIRYLFCRIGAPKFNKSEVVLGLSRYLKLVIMLLMALVIS
nr:MAG TPA: hypothetical protein [Caudoviricetes sp.]